MGGRGWAGELLGHHRAYYTKYSGLGHHQGAWLIGHKSHLIYNSIQGLYAEELDKLAQKANVS